MSLGSGKAFGKRGGRREGSQQRGGGPLRVPKIRAQPRYPKESRRHTPPGEPSKLHLSPAVGKRTHGVKRVRGRRGLHEDNRRVGRRETYLVPAEK